MAALNPPLDRAGVPPIPLLDTRHFDPFYAVWGIGGFSVNPYDSVWPRQKY